MPKGVMKVAYSPEQEVAWCQTIIRRQAIMLWRKYQRWGNDELILNMPNEFGEERPIPDSAAAKDFDDAEWDLMLAQVLTPLEDCVIRQLYMAGQSQRGVAHQCLVSQSKVSRTQQQALRKLREAMAE